jgi:hypothetical protein
MELYVALLHYPVYNKNGRIVATAVTNTDVHDISRLSATFGVKGFFIVTPVEQQRVLVADVVRHWTEGAGAGYNPRRKEALALARTVGDLDEAVRQVRLATGHTPLTIGTGANIDQRMVSFEKMGELLAQREGAALLIFGTGWGLERSFLQALDFNLAPVRGRGEYNHLSVRSAAAIVLDRLVGRG